MSWISRWLIAKPTGREWAPAEPVHGGTGDRLRLRRRGPRFCRRKVRSRTGDQQSKVANHCAAHSAAVTCLCAVRGTITGGSKALNM